MTCRDPYRFRWIILGHIGWISLGIFVAGFTGLINGFLGNMWTLFGIFGLASALGLSETLKREVRALRQHVDSLVGEARTDVLSGLANRRAFNEQLTRDLSQSNRQGTALSLLLIDLDHFKALNDNHGHQVGDAALQDVARTLYSTLREMDLIERYGGDEFAVILPGTRLSAAMKAAERVRTAVAERTFAVSGSEVLITVSVGVSEVMPPDDVNGIVTRADVGLYAAKAAGRNCSYGHNGKTSQSINDIPATDVDIETLVSIS